MKVEELIKYQPTVVELLSRAKQKKRLSHAYLFEGEEGSGTKEAALYFSMMLLCKEKDGPCFKCNTCERIIYNSYMSVVLIEPINNVINKEQITSLINDFNHTMIEGDANIYIIKDADKMNTQAVNSLLKMLEEPAPNHYVVLTTTNHHKILDTIVSRCQYVHFNSPSASLVKEHLTNNKIKEDIAYVVSYITLDFDEALNISKDDTFIKLYNLAKSITSLKYKKKDTFVEYYLNKEFLLSLDYKYQYMFLDILTLLNKDLYCVKENIKSQEDILLKDINLKNFDKEYILNNIEIINKYEIRLNSNINLDLLYCSMFCEF